MKYLLIENKGLLDPLAIFMMGASSKRNDSTKIGRFGSGFKYALARLLNMGISVKIFSGTEEIQIGTVEFNLKGRIEPFKAITVNGERTSITTEMGPDWKPWQVLREIWCNALDEGEADIRKEIDPENIQGIENYTRIYIEQHSYVDDVLFLWNTYFNSDREDKVAICNPIYDKSIDVSPFKIFMACDSKTILYRHGIMVHQNDRLDALYHYDYTGFEINEERIISNYHYALYELAEQLAKNATEEVAKQILKNAAKLSTFENTFRWDGYTLNENWKSAAACFDHIILNSRSGYYTELLAKDNNAFVSDELGKMLMAIGVKVKGLDSAGKKNGWLIIEDDHWTQKQAFLLKQTMSALDKELGYPIIYPVYIAEFDNKHVLARAYNDNGNHQILLSPRLFDMGKRQIAMALMEEQEHLNTELSDETRGLQDHLFSKWLAAMEEKAGYFF